MVVEQTETRSEDNTGLGRFGGGHMEHTPVTPSKPFPCPECDASFDTNAQRGGHIAGKHRKPNSGRPPKKRYPSDDPEYKRKKREEKRLAKLSRKPVKRFLSAASRRRISESAKRRWKATNARRNGFVDHIEETITPQLDFSAAADRIIECARTLTMVAMGERLP